MKIAFCLVGAIVTRLVWQGVMGRDELSRSVGFDKTYKADEQGLLTSCIVTDPEVCEYCTYARRGDD